MPTVVENDLACRTCRYNLRTLTTDGRCPECGELVMHSLAYAAAWAPGEKERFVRAATAMGFLDLSLILVPLMFALFDSTFLGPAAKSLLFFYFLTYAIGYSFVIRHMTAGVGGARSTEVERMRIAAAGMVIAAAIPIVVNDFGGLSFGQTWIYNCGVAFVLLLSPSPIFLCLKLGWYFDDRCTVARLPFLAGTSRLIGRLLCTVLVVIAV